jgi:uncharacterized protein (TIGR03067 family)
MPIVSIGQFVLRGDRLTWASPPGQSRETVRLHATSPKGIDFIFDDSGKCQRGLYYLEGDTLTMVVAAPEQPRPTSFDSGGVKLVYRRLGP